MQLRGFAELPADTFAEGPPSAQYDGEGNLRSEPLYEGQPVQGFSGVQFADQGSYWFLSDNGFGAKLNSQDYLLRIYQVNPSFRGEDSDGSVEVADFIQFADPDQKVPFPIKNEDTSDRLLTGFDFDPESFVVADDGSLWVGEEFGPYLLHFDASGKLLEAPYSTPNFGSESKFVRSPDNPAVLAGDETANLSRSKGFEGLAINPDKTKLYALLEGSVEGDSANALRLYEFDLAAQEFTEITGNYRLDNPDYAIGDITVINENEFLVVERDNLQGDEAEFKKVFKIDISQQNADGYVAKEEVADLLNISDLEDLNNDGSTDFRFPFVTIEDVLVVDEDTILVANDNNYRAVGGRPPEPDQNEILLLDLETPLDIDPRIGRDAMSGNELKFGKPESDDLVAAGNKLVFAGEGDDIIDATIGDGNNRLYGGEGDDELLASTSDRLFGEAGNDILDASVGKGNNRLYGGEGNDTIFAGSSDLLLGNDGDDTLFAGSGDSTLTGGAGKDQLWIVAGDVPGAANTVTDFQLAEDVLGLGAGLAFANLEITQSGSDTLISFKDSTPIATLTGVEANDLSIANFVSTAPRPLIIGHRGASGFRPEHTLEAYELAIEQGADYIEPDLVSTKDGVLIARHENEISGTTDVAERSEFADRETTKVIDGVEITGWFTEDFTLEEIKTLRAKERIPEIRPDSAEYDGLFEVPTFQEVIDLAQQKSAETGRTIGIYPETKHPTYFDSIGLSLEEPLVATLEANNLTDANDPVFIQSFETANLKELNEEIDVPLVQLFGSSDTSPYDFVVNNDPRTYGDLTSPEELANIAEYADGIGPDKRLIVPANEVGELQAPTTLVDDAHAAGLLVHPYTFRSEDTFLAPEYNSNPELEFEQFFSLGVDGLFTDFPGTGFEVANRLYPFNDVEPLLGVGLIDSSTVA